jgi:hypothetical protein
MKALAAVLGLVRIACVVLCLVASRATVGAEADASQPMDWTRLKAALEAAEGWPSGTIRSFTLPLRTQPGAPDLFVTSSEVCGTGTCRYHIYEIVAGSADPVLYREIGAVDGIPSRAESVSHGRHDLWVRSRLGADPAESSKSLSRFDGERYR